MLKKIILLCLVITSVYTINAYDIVTVVLMVKNEESVIAKTLEPYVKAGITSYLIFDTGSTDDTISNAKTFFKLHGIEHYLILQEPFIDFATSRNRALDLADEHFPDSCFLLMPDAEWYMHNVEGLLNFCVEQCDKNTPCYLVRIMNETVDFSVPRLIRARAHARFAGAVHESIPVESTAKVPSNVYFELGASRQGMEKSRKRWERDLAILLKEYEKNPNHSRTTFYLAQTYECLGDLKNAHHYYTLRSALKGWLEEDYETFYRLGYITERLSQTDPDYTWHMAYDYYTKAHDMLPSRAEPLVRIANHYWPDGGAPLNIALCYIFAKRACEIDYPENAFLFVDPNTYTFQRYELLSKSAWHIGDFENGEIATRNALKKKELPYLLKNLAYYLERRAAG